VPGAGLMAAGSIVVLLALGVAISNADWREWVGEGGGETTLFFYFFIFFIFFYIMYSLLKYKNPCKALAMT